MYGVANKLAKFNYIKATKKINFIHYKPPFSFAKWGFMVWQTVVPSLGISGDAPFINIPFGSKGKCEIYKGLLNIYFYFTTVYLLILTEFPTPVLSMSPAPFAK